MSRYFFKKEVKEDKNNYVRCAGCDNAHTTLHVVNIGDHDKIYLCERCLDTMLATRLTERLEKKAKEKEAESTG